MAIMSIADALKAAIAEEMRRDPTVYCLGEDEDIPGGMGGAFTVTKGLGDEFGANVRVPEKNGGYVPHGAGALSGPPPQPPTRARTRSRACVACAP